MKCTVSTDFDGEIQHGNGKPPCAIGDTSSNGVFFQFSCEFSGAYISLCSSLNIPKSKSLRHHWKLKLAINIEALKSYPTCFSGTSFFSAYARTVLSCCEKESLMVLNQLLHRVQECSRTFSGFPAVKFPKCMM